MIILPLRKPNDEGADLVELLKVTSYAVVEVFLLCAVGYILGKRGVIDGKIKRSLNLVRHAPAYPWHWTQTDGGTLAYFLLAQYVSVHSRTAVSVIDG